VTGRIADIALSEMNHRGHARRSPLMEGRNAFGLFALLCLLAVALLYHQSLSEAVSALFAPRPAATGSVAPPDEAASTPAAEPPRPQTPTAGASTAAPATDANTPIPVGERTAAPLDGARLAEHLKRASSRASRQTALSEVMKTWGANFEPKNYLEAVDDDPTFFNLSAKAAGFLVQRIEGDLEFLRRLNMPAILEFPSTGKQPHAYLGLTAVVGSKFLLRTGDGDRAIESDVAELGRSWNGIAYLPWKNLLSLSGTIPGNAPTDSVLALKMLLRDLGHTGIPLSKEYDAATQKTVEQIQAKYGVPVDGVVGNLTKIILYREGTRFDIPRLVSN
jgi:hypothetical protein